MTRTLLRVAATGLVLSGLVALGLRLNVPTGTADHADNQHWPDFYVEQPHWREFDREGRLSRELHAARVEQWPHEHRARLIEPRLRVSDARQQHWQASAQLGWVPPDRRQLVLEGGVRLSREPENTGPVVTTEQLRIGTRDNVIQTERPVVMVSGKWHFTAAGLQADLGRQQLQLQGNVRGIHD